MWSYLLGVVMWVAGAMLLVGLVYAVGVILGTRK